MLIFLHKYPKEFSYESFITKPPHVRDVAAVFFGGGISDNTELHNVQHPAEICVKKFVKTRNECK